MESASTILRAVCAVFFLIGRGFAWLVNRVFRRRVLNTAVVGLVFTLPWSLAPVYVLLTNASGKLSRLGAEDQGYMVAMFVIPSVLVFGLGIWLAVRESKRASSTLSP